MKSRSGLTKHMNTCTSQIIQQFFPTRMQPAENMPMPGEYDNASDNLGLHEDEKSTLEEQDIKNDPKNLVSKSSDAGSQARNIMLGRTPQDGLLGSKLSSSLKEVRFTVQEFPAGTSVSNIKYHHLGLQNNYPFYPFHDQLDYALAHYCPESETTKGNIDKFFFELLMAPLTEKLSHRNTDEWMKKLLEIPWGIPNDKWTEHKFELANGIAGMPRREISIHSQNVVSCPEFLMGHPGFRHNQTYEPSYVFNDNENRVYNEMHTGK